jgi:hypothetical protein
MKCRIGIGGDHSGCCGKVLLRDSNLYVRAGLQIPEPLGGGILGDHVEATAEFRKPDLNFAWKAGLATARCEIEILFAATVL